jgi:capsid protein
MDSFTRQGLRGVAAGIGGISGSELSLDFAQLSFSAARLERNSTSPRIYQRRWHMLIPHLCDGLWRWVMQDAVRRGEIPEAPPARHTPPPAQEIDPEKEGKAFREGIRSGKKTLIESIREEGNDPEAHLDEMKEGFDMLDARELTLDCDPRRTSSTGQLQGGGGSRDSGFDKERMRELMREVLVDLLEERASRASD